MNAIDVIKFSLKQSEGWVLGLVEDMKDAPLTFPTPQGGNHPLWVIGHLAYAEGMLIGQYVLGEENPLIEWQSLFDMGTQPVDQAEAYPSIDEVIGRYREIRAGTMAYVETLSEADLDQRSHAADEIAENFGTVGKCLISAALHFTFHGGQVADARRAAGRAVLMA